MATIELADLIEAARDLRSDLSTDNPEYDRALVELVSNVTVGADDFGRELVRIAILGGQPLQHFTTKD